MSVGHKTPEEWQKEHQIVAPPPSGCFFAIFSQRLGCLRYAPVSCYVRRAHAAAAKKSQKLDLTINARNVTLACPLGIGLEIP